MRLDTGFVSQNHRLILRCYMLTAKDKKFLADNFSDNFLLYKEGGVDYINKLHDLAREQRQFILNLSTVSGAIAAFSIPLLQEFKDISVVFLFLSLVCQFVVIIMGFVGLSFEQDTQIKGTIIGLRDLEKNYHSFQNAITQSIDQDGMSPLVTFIEKRKTKAQNSTQEFKFEWIARKSIMLTFLAFALVLVLIATYLQYSEHFSWIFP